jgi:Tfp pilus assembly protein PilO
MSRFIPIISVILLVILLVGGYFFWWPKYQEFRRQSAALEQETKALEQKNNYYSKLEEISNKLAAYKDEINKIDSALPAEASLPVLFDFIKKTSMENELILNSISPSGAGKSSSKYNKSNANTEISAETAAGVEKISISISLSGAYPALKNFLSAIYKNARLIEVNSISFSSPSEADLFNFDLSLETYVLPNPETAPAKTASPEVAPR